MNRGDEAISKRGSSVQL